jgi:prepilin-type N-terminal cleavage/methylation domain-containing protein
MQRGIRGPARNRPMGFTLVELLVVIAIIGVLVGLLLPAVQAAREAARRNACGNNSKQIAAAFLNHESALERFPWAGNNGPTNCCDPDVGAFDRYNWPFHVLPFVERAAEYDIGLADRARLALVPVGTFLCPTRRAVQIYRGAAKSDYAANLGTSNTNGVVVAKAHGVPKLRDITDGMSKTLLVAEKRIHRAYMETGGVAGGFANDDAHAYHSDNEACYFAGWADDVERRGSSPPAPDLTDPTMPGSIVGPHFGSAHSGGISATFCDGSVSFISFEIDPEVFRRLSVKNDGLVVQSQ